MAESLEQDLKATEIYEDILKRASVLDVLSEDETPERKMFYGELGIAQTPLIEPKHLHLVGHNLLVKDETRQNIGAFKARGAAFAIMEAVRENPDLEAMVTASAGNHARGVMDPAAKFGLKAVIECTDYVSPLKKAALEKAGATVHDVHQDLEKALAVAESLQSPNTAFIHPFDNPNVIAGQASLAFEVVRDLVARQNEGLIDLHKDPLQFTVPVGGGGLIAAFAVVIRNAQNNGLLGKNNVRVVGMQMEGCAKMTELVREQQTGEAPDDSNPIDTSCDGTAVNDPGELALQLIANGYVDELATVTKDELALGMLDLAKVHQTMVEPAGALSYAGAKLLAQNTSEKTTFVTITSGKNVTPELYREFTDEPYERARRKIIAMYASGFARAELDLENPSNKPLQVWSAPTAEHKQHTVKPLKAPDLLRILND